ncbi:MAG: exopolyphosphatase [Planctomycetes bacterium]|nr:exopolyphosphatase [Planctomycetota bacterium]
MRILTRGDLDGMTSSLLLTIAEKVDEIRFAHPKDVQDGRVEATSEDIVVNLPYVKGCGMWFDHHISEEGKVSKIGHFKGKYGQAPSAARLVYEHYRRPEFEKFQELLKETDRLDSAHLNPEDVTDPKGWILLGYTLDPRTGLGPEFQKYFRWLVEVVKEVSIEKILQHREVKKRADRVRNEIEEFRKLLQQHARLEGKVIITDFRSVKDAPVGNRFLVYTLFPAATVEARILRGKEGKTVNVAIGHSIFNRTCAINVGSLCAEYGGGGHAGAGTCQLDPATAEEKICGIVARLNAG